MLFFWVYLRTRGLLNRETRAQVEFEHALEMLSEGCSLEELLNRPKPGGTPHVTLRFTSRKCAEVSLGRT